MMFEWSSFVRALDKVRASPQILLTGVVAVAIFASFLFVSLQFAGIARDAQERLVNVRVGALQDAFTPLAALYLNDPYTLRQYMLGITEKNPTIKEFIVAERVGGDWYVLSSLDERQIGTDLAGYDFVLSLAVADPENSFTVEEVGTSERFFRTARAVRDEGGAVAGVAVTLQSLSEADSQIASSINKGFFILAFILLVLLVLFFHHARIIDYTELYRRLKEVDALKDDFVSMVSHELRSPVTIIRGYTADLKERGGVAPPETLEKIDQAALALNFLIGDILDVVKIEEGRLSYTITNVSVERAVARVVEELTPQATKKGLTLTASVPNVAVAADENRLHQVLTNLVTNAIKYSDKGAATITGTVSDTSVTLRVSDSGIGISAEDQKKLFSRFYRVAGERVRREVGTGLGLWITKKLIEGMRGSVAVESIVGVGTHFVVTLPLAPK